MIIAPHHVDSSRADIPAARQPGSRVLDSVFRRAHDSPIPLQRFPAAQVSLYHRADRRTAVLDVGCGSSHIIRRAAERQRRARLDYDRWEWVWMEKAYGIAAS